MCDKLWAEGYYTDLIPSSEIANGSLKIAEDGQIQYGPQRYAAVVLYHPDGERPEIAEFFRKAANQGKTSLWRVGDWKMDFEGKPFSRGCRVAASNGLWRRAYVRRRRDCPPEDFRQRATNALDHAERASISVSRRR